MLASVLGQRLTLTGLGAAVGLLSAAAFTKFLEPAGTLSLGTPGQNGSLTFTGTGGQQVSVHVTGNTAGTITVRLLRPDGTIMTTTVSAAASFNLTTQTLAVAGTYTITVDPSGANNGNVNVNVTSP